MARKLRLEEVGAVYHVINRGNYRRDLFDSAGAATAFVNALFEAADQFNWKVYAYVLMRNHFHLAVETLDPTLGEGMHWLQVTMAIRFNRFRNERGHLFQGRYKAMPIEDDHALGRVVDYIHLNPVRAKVVEAEWLPKFRWSSLPALLKCPRPERLVAEPWLHSVGRWPDDREGIAAYGQYLVELARNEAAWEEKGLVGLAKGWAIGTSGWRKALAQAYAQTALAHGMTQAERRELRIAAWESALAAQLRQSGRTEEDLLTRPAKQGWKLELAQRLRNENGAQISWLAPRLHLGQADSVRRYLYQLRQSLNPQNSS